jgi:translation initiation factor IF-1
MVKEKDKIAHIGTIIESLPNATFRVRLDGGKEVFGYISGKMRKYYIKILVGDKVKIEFSPYDDTRGRIIQRL